MKRDILFPIVYPKKVAYGFDQFGSRFEFNVSCNILVLLQYHRVMGKNGTDRIEKK